jgi:hypothetical protein
VRPDYVDIGPMRYRIHADRTKIDRERVDARESGMAAQITYSAGRIVLDDTHRMTYQKRSLLHEIMHGCLESVGFDQASKVSAETLIDHLDGTLLDVLQRNPQVTNWLVEREEHDA